VVLARLVDCRQRGGRAAAAKEVIHLQFQLLGRQAPNAELNRPSPTISA
jgi:hypothetical protein